MFPTLITFGPFTIRSYGLLVAVGLFLSLKYILHYSKKNKIEENLILDLVLYMVVAGLIGARITYVLLNLQFYLQHLSDVFKIWEGGLVFYGGFLAGIAAALVFIRSHSEINLKVIADIFAPTFALGHFFGRVGCFFAGCCYGVESHLPWAVKFTNPSALAPLGVPLHPVQLYEAIGNLCIFFSLHWYNKHRHSSGETFISYLFFYAFMRFNLEFLRGDDRGGFILGVSPSQIVSGAIVLATILIIYQMEKSNGKTDCR